MKYSDIQNYLEKGETGILELLKQIKNTIDTIEDYQEKFKSNLLTEETELREALNVFTGIFSEVTTIFRVAEIYSEVNEAKELLLAKNTLVDDGKGNKKSPTDEVAKAIAKEKNKEYAKLANLFRAYSQVVGQNIITCQSQLNYLKEQKFIPQENI